MMLKLLIVSFVSLCTCCAASHAYLIGTYASISESEWNVIVEMKPKGNLIITNENWTAGEYAKRTSKQTQGKWKMLGKKILFCYGGICDTMGYSDSLSLEDIGQQGSAPGIAPLGKTQSNSLISNTKLWRLPHNFILKK